MKSKAVAIISITLVGLVLVLPTTSHAWRGGWGWGPGAFVGGALLGAAFARPYYAYPPPPVYYPPPAVVYAPPPAYAYPSPPPAYAPNQAYVNPGPPAVPQAAPTPPIQGKGQWVEVPGQTVNKMWVPPHTVWVPDNGADNSRDQPANESHSGAREGS